MIPNYSTLMFRRCEDGIRVYYDRCQVDTICVSQELLREAGWQTHFPALSEHFGLVETDGETAWPGDKLYQVTKPGAPILTIARVKK